MEAAGLVEEADSAAVEEERGEMYKISPNKDNQPRRTQRAQRIVVLALCPLCTLWFIYYYFVRVQVNTATLL